MDRQRNPKKVIMGIYFIKFTACLAVLYFFYKVFLENENMHTFKRIYLLVSLAVALIIPAIVFTEYVEKAPPSGLPVQEYTTPLRTESTTGTATAVASATPNIATILWTLYHIGVLFFGLKFIKNLSQILGRVRNNPKQRWKKCIQVLLKDKLPPHTFLNYIFLNRQKFEANQIPREVLLHEQTHALQKHSYDILFVEFLQVIFWVNPFVFMTKKAIKLNHEFLADEAVLNHAISKTDYQNTLLSFLSIDSTTDHQSSLVNPINYSSIKKRFKLMKTQTSKRAILIRSLLTLPLLALLLYGFSTTTKIIKISKESTIQISQSLENYTITDLDFLITTDGILSLNEKVISIENIQSGIRKLNPSLTTEQNGKYVYATISTETEDYQELVSRVTNELLKSNIYNLSISNINTLKSLNIYKKSFSKYHGKSIEEAELIYLEQVANPTKIDTPSLAPGWNVTMNAVPLNEIIMKDVIGPKQLEPITEILIHINNKGQLLIDNDLVALADLKEYLFKINPHLTTAQRQTVVRSIIKVDSKPPKDIIEAIEKLLIEYGTATINIVGRADTSQSGQEQNATRAEIEEYNTMAKKYNDMDRNQMRIKSQEVQRLKELYTKMSNKQRETAELFPDFPEPPPVPKAPKAPNKNEKHLTETIQVKKEEIVTHRISGSVPSAPKPP
jgi:bla regulator protein blaR1